jgi:hypothetical protein
MRIRSVCNHADTSCEPGRAKTLKQASLAKQNPMDQDSSRDPFEQLTD